MNRQIVHKHNVALKVTLDLRYAVEDTAHLSKERQKYVAKLLVEHNKKKLYLPLSVNLTFTKSAWKKFQKAKSPHFNMMERDFINTYNSINEQDFFELGKLKVNTSNSEDHWLKLYIEKRQRQYDKEFKEREVSTYKNSWSWLVRVMERYNNGNIPKIEQVDGDLIRSWEEKHLAKPGNTASGFGIYMTFLRTAMNEAQRKGVINEPQNPFKNGEYKVKTSNSRKLYIDKKFMQDLQDYPVMDEDKAFYRDIFLLRFFLGGMDNIDIWKMKVKEISGSLFSFSRAKILNNKNYEDSQIMNKINESAKHIIDKWKVGKDPEDFVFPVLAGVSKSRVSTAIHNANIKSNNAIKGIAKKMKHPNWNKISAKQVRHLVAVEVNSQRDIYLAKETLGHKNISTTERYLHGLKETEREQVAETLTF